MPTMSRRQLLRILGVLGAQAALLGAGCSTEPVTEEKESPTATPPAVAPTETVTPPAVAPTETVTPLAVAPADSATPPAVAPTDTVPPLAVAPTETVIPPTVAPARSQPHLAVARGADPATITQRAIAAIGGMERFCKPGADVIIKPNICVSYHSYEYAATTNPQVVGELVRLCLAAGARRVRVMDTPFGGRAEDAYAVSGIQAAVQEAGGEMEIMSPVKYQEVAIPEGKDLNRWTVYRDLLEADLVINVPIAKHHNLSRLTLGGKNLLGVVSRPNQLHRNLGQRVADLVSLFRPQLTVVDAVRILTNRGPSGGNLDDVKKLDTVIASHDIVAADAYAATLFGLQGEDIGYVKAAAEMGLGTLDLQSIQIEEISV